MRNHCIKNEKKYEFYRLISRGKIISFQNNSNGTESLVKIIDKPSKADHTASHLRHTPLCEIVTTPDYVNREKKTNPHTTESTGNGAQRFHEENRQ